MIKAGLFIILLFHSLSGNMHKYYMSITEVEWNVKTQSAEIIINVFVDDFEKALREATKRKISYGSSRFEKAATAYVNSHFALKLPGNKLVAVNWIGIKLSKDVLSIYIEATNIKTLNNCIIRNSILTESIEAQTNMINIVEGNNKKTFILSRSHLEEGIHF
jgi:hypothetical protein